MKIRVYYPQGNLEHLQLMLNLGFCIYHKDLWSWTCTIKFYIRIWPHSSFSFLSLNILLSLHFLKEETIFLNQQLLFVCFNTCGSIVPKNLIPESIWRPLSRFKFSRFSPTRQVYAVITSRHCSLPSRQFSTPYNSIFPSKALLGWFSDSSNAAKT